MKAYTTWLLGFILSLMLGMMSLPTSAQQLPSDSLNGFKAYESLNYSEALKYLLVYHHEKKTRRSIYAIAECYRQIQDYREAEKWYDKAIKLGNPLSETRFYYAEVLQANGKYIKAIKQYLLTKPVEEKEVKLVERRIYSCEFADSIIKLSNEFTIKNAKEYNTEFSEFGILPYGSGKVYCSDQINKNGVHIKGPKSRKIYARTDRGYLHLFFIDHEKKDSTPTITTFDALNQLHIGPIVFSKNQDIAFFTITRKMTPQKWTNHLLTLNSLSNRIEIYYSRKIGGHWSNGVSVPFNDATQFSVGHPAISPNDSLLYFVSDMPGGKGGTDLYFVEMHVDSTKGSIRFGKPINLGNTINTEGNEKFPSFQPNGELYFSSDGLTGLGGLDIFRTRGEKTEWLKPDNLGFPINSSKDDFLFLVQDQNRGGYFSSNREGGKGNDDLYSFLQINPLKPLEIEDSLKTNVRCQNDSILVVKDQKLNFSMDSATYAKNYNRKFIDFSKNSYDIVQDSLFTAKKHLKKKRDKLKNIGHEFDKYALDSLAIREVDSAIAILLKHPDVKLKVIGHADSRGTDHYNLILSKKRAEAVAERLLKAGVDQKRVDIKWEGARKPKVPCPINKDCTEEDYARNRKTELNVTKISSLTSLEEDTSVAIEERELVAPTRIIKKSSFKDQTLDTISQTHLIIRHDNIEAKPIHQVTNGIENKTMNMVEPKIAKSNELFDALGEMTIDTIYLTPRNLLVIRETDGTMQRIFLPPAVLEGDQLIVDQTGTRWIVSRDRRVFKVKPEKKDE